RAETERQRDRAEKIAEAEARQKNEAKRQRDRAEEQQRLAEKNAREANRQRERAEKNAAEAQRQRDRERESFRDAHEVVNEFCLQLSQVDLRAYPGMQPLRKKLLEGGLQYLQRFVDRNEGDPKLRAKLAHTFFDLGQVANTVGTRQEAIRAYQRALSLYRELSKEDPDNADRKQQIVATLINLGNLEHERGRDDETRKLLREAR